MKTSPLSPMGIEANSPIWVHSTCPLDCPSTCAIEVELLDSKTIGRVRGRSGHPYTDGVICGKVSRYADRNHHMPNA